MSSDLAFPYPLPPRVLDELSGRLADLRPEATAETGCGASTLVFSRYSARHTVFAFNEFKVFDRVRARLQDCASKLEFIEGPTQHTLTRYCFETPLDAVLLDGPHAYPFPELEYFFFYPQLRRGALLIVDDIQIPSVHHLYRFLRRDAMFRLERVLHRTAFFRRTDAPTHPPDADGWQRQGFNSGELLRYTWRQRIRQALGRD